MYEDRYGNPVSTSSQAARDHYVDAVDGLLAAFEGVEEAFQRAIDEDPDFILAHIGLSRQHQMRGATALSRKSVETALEISRHVSNHEKSHINAMSLLLQGKIPAAIKAIRSHITEYPRDAVVAQTCMGVFGLIGFSGQPGREAEQLAFTTSLAPHYGDDWWFLGQHAFAQLEIGQLGPAEKSIEPALAQNPKSGVNAHIRSHLYYENGESAAGLGYLEAWRDDYSREAMMHCHLSWHIALWSLEQGNETRMWEIFDTDILPDGGATGPALNVATDAPSLLYRAELAGVQVSAERWQSVSEYVSGSFPKTGLAFADVHAALAHAMAGNMDSLQKIIKDARGPAGDLVKLFAEAFEAVASASWRKAADLLSVALTDHARIGGSRAQRDLLEFILALALLKLGRAEDARLFLNMHRPNVPASAIAGL
ncbi:MAG: tetratricopeptide repeat protein [Pseudomonadota bacterium]